MNITVYLGANEGNNSSFKDAIKELGEFIGKRKDTLIYGGSKTGLMGILADGVLDSGGLVIGVEPQMFIDQDVQHNGLTKLIVTKDIPERRTKMIELGDAFIAFPGGTGTLEEISEVMSLIALNRIDSPCIIYNLNGYYDGLKELLDTMVKFGFSSDERQSKIHIVNNISEIESILQ